MSEVRKMARVAIVDDHVLFREGLAAILARSERYEIVFQGECAQDAVKGVIDHAPDLLLLDLGMPGESLDALRKIKSIAPETFCVILTSCDDPIKAMAAMSLGAEGYVLKGIKSDNLLVALDGILSKQTYVSPEFAMRLIKAADEASQKKNQSRLLSHREEQVITEVQKGLTNRQVADRLKLSEQTVKFYMSSVMQKMGVHNRVAAVQAYQRLSMPSRNLFT